MRRIAFTALVVCALAGLTSPAAAAEMTGKEVFDHYCTQCHGSADGPGTWQLRRTRGKDRALLTEREDLAADYIEYIVRHGLKSMPPFTPADLPDARLKALMDFLTKRPAKRKQPGP